MKGCVLRSEKSVWRFKWARAKMHATCNFSEWFVYPTVQLFVCYLSEFVQGCLTRHYENTKDYANSRVKKTDIGDVEDHH